VGNNPQAPSTADQNVESLTGTQASDRKVVYWHRELPPIDAEPLGEYVVEADSVRVAGRLDRGSELWDRCYRDLMAQFERRLRQEARRLGGHYAHVLEETVSSRRDDRTQQYWLRGRVRYLLLRQSDLAAAR
jgi:hypothetical protein